MDATALQRQNRRIERLKSQGVHRAIVLVHEQCRPMLDSLRPHFIQPEKVEQLSLLVEQLHKKPSRPMSPKSVTSALSLSGRENLAGAGSPAMAFDSKAAPRRFY